MTARRWQTADDLLRELEAKPEYLERQRGRMEQRVENRRRYAEAAAGLVADLRAAGFAVSTVAELRKRGVGGRRAVPLLVRWLTNVSYLPLKRDIVATLGSPWARPDGARPLLREYRSIDPREDPPGGLRWAIGDALERVADESVLDDVLAIATDKQQGRERALVVVSLGNMVKERERVVPVLLDLLGDADVAPYAVMGLGKLRAAEARSAIERFLNDPEPWVRKEAKKALARLAD